MSSAAIKQRDARAIRSELRALALALSDRGDTLVAGDLPYPQFIHNRLAGVSKDKDLSQRIKAVNESASQCWLAELDPEAPDARALRVLRGHKPFIVHVAYSPDGKQLTSASWDKTVRLWDAETGAALGAPLTGHTAKVLHIALSPDGKRLASASEDCTVRLWDAETGAALEEPLTGHTATVLHIAFSPNGKQLASASWDNTVRLWDAETGAALGELLTGYQANVRRVAFSSDGKQLVSASWDNTVRPWVAGTGAALGELLTGDIAAVKHIAFSPDGKQLASASEDCTVRLWDVHTTAEFAVEYDVASVSLSWRDGILWVAEEQHGSPRRRRFRLH